MVKDEVKTECDEYYEVMRRVVFLLSLANCSSDRVINQIPRANKWKLKVKFFIQTKSVTAEVIQNKWTYKVIGECKTGSIALTS